MSFTITPELLDALLSPQAARRQPAEAHYTTAPAHSRLAALASALLSILAAPPHQAQLVAVLVRREILQFNDNVMELESLIVLPLVQAMMQSPPSPPPDDHHMVKLGHCVAEACALASAWNHDAVAQRWMQTLWHQVLRPRLLNTTSTNVTESANAVQCTVALAERAPRAFSVVVLPHLPALLSSTATTTTSSDCWLLPLVVYAACATSDGAIRQQLGRHVATLLLHNTMTPNILQVLLHGTEHAPELYSHCWSAVLTALINEMQNNKEVQLPALQVIVEVSSICKKSMDTSHKRALLQATLPRLCSYLTQADEWDPDDSLFLLEYDVLANSNDDVTFATELLERMLQTFGPAALDLLLPQIETWLNASSSWPQSLAALLALSCAVLALPRRMTALMHTSVVPAALQLAKPYQESQVQQQAVTLLALCCESGSDNVRAPPTGPHILECLAQACQTQCAHVSAVACTAIVSYCRGNGQLAPEMVAPTLESYLEPLLQALVVPLAWERATASIAVVQTRAVQAVACIAQTVGGAFAPYYTFVAPGLLSLAQLPPTSLEVTDLAGAALEAVTIIGQALGDEHQSLFRTDATQIMDWAVMQLQTAATTVAMSDQLLAACARIASVLGPDYAPYAQVVLPILLQRATRASDVEVAAGNEAGLDATRTHGAEVNEDAGTHSMTVVVPGQGLAKVTINTTQMQEKEQAVRAIYEHAAALGGAFGPYAKTCLDEFLPLVEFRYSADIRGVAAQTVAAIFEAACEFGEEDGESMSVPATYMPLIMKALTKQLLEEGEDADMDVIYALADSLSEACYSVYRRLRDDVPTILAKYSVGQSKPVVECCIKGITQCLDRRVHLTNVLSGAEGELEGEDERQEYVDLLAAEEKLLTPLVDSVGYNLKFFGTQFVPIFDSLVAPVLGPYLNAGNDLRARVSAVCLFDDCVEHCGPTAASKFGAMLAHGVMAGIDDATNGGDTDLRQASLYGITQLARYAPPNTLMPHAKFLASYLATVASKSKDEAGSVFGFENAVSALAALFLLGPAPFQSSGLIKVDVAQQIFLRNLPLSKDYDEAKINHAGLCDLVQQQKLQIKANAADLVRIIGATLALVADEEDVATEDTCQRMVGILGEMQATLPQHQVQQYFGQLEENDQAAVHEAMNRYAYLHSNLVTP